jgi:hypothetical protein
MHKKIPHVPYPDDGVPELFTNKISSKYCCKNKSIFAEIKRSYTNRYLLK